VICGGRYVREQDGSEQLRVAGAVSGRVYGREHGIDPVRCSGVGPCPGGPEAAGPGWVAGREQSVRDGAGESTDGGRPERDV